MINAIIVDDELKSRESLKILLEDFCTDVRVVELCQNVAEGIDAIKKYRPDVVFLDIQMQRETGFDLLNKLDNVSFELVFTTAYSEFAIKAFKFSALDYLLKPIDIEELQNAVEKAKKRVKSNSSDRIENLIKNLKADNSENYKIALPTSDGLIFIRMRDIVYCEAESNYTAFHLKDGKKYLVSKTLKDYDELLGEHYFFRIHNSFVINLNEIKKYVRGEGGYVVMNNEVSLDVSKRRKEAFIQKITSQA